MGFGGLRNGLLRAEKVALKLRQLSLGHSTLSNFTQLTLSPLARIMGKTSKDKRDAYYRLAKEQGWRARSAFKLLQIDEEFQLFKGVNRVVDLCAAPGSWSQVLSRVDAKIVSIDLQPMTPIPGIIMLQADITAASTVPKLLSALGCVSDSSGPSDPSPSVPSSLVPSSSDPSSNPSSSSSPFGTSSSVYSSNTHLVDLVLSDGAPDVTGLYDFDIYIQRELLFSALNLAVKVLRPGGTFVAKVFRGKDVDTIYASLSRVFELVHVAKPRSSRASSVEAFVVCRGFKIPDGMGDGPIFGGAASEENRSILNRMNALSVAGSCGSKGLSHTSHLSYASHASQVSPNEFPDVVVLNLNSEDEDENEDGGGYEDEDDSWEDPPGNPRDDSRVIPPHKWIAPFVACGELTSFDSDATYRLPKDHKSLDPVQPPTAPPYKKALERKRATGGVAKAKKDNAKS